MPSLDFFTSWPAFLQPYPSSPRLSRSGRPKRAGPYSAEKFLRENQDKVPVEVKSEVESAIGELQEKLRGEDTAAVRTASEHLAQVSQRLGLALYQQGSGSAAAGGQGQEQEEVVDAEIVDEEQPQRGDAA